MIEKGYLSFDRYPFSIYECYFLNIVMIAISIITISVTLSTIEGIAIAKLVPKTAPTEPKTVAQSTVLR